MASAQQIPRSEVRFAPRRVAHGNFFVSDLERGYEALREDILTDSERFRAAKARYESLGLMTVA